MSPAICPSCGTAHGPTQRYCLGCGTLVGERSVDVDRLVAPAPAATHPPAPAPAVAEVGVWRRPVTSIATALALAAGVTVGFLTTPQGGEADGTPVALSRSADTSPPAATADALSLPAPDGTTATDAAEPAPTPEEPSASADAAEAPADADAAAPAPEDTPTPAPAAVPDAAPATRADATTTTSTAKKHASAADRAKPAAPTPALPKVEHVWVIGIGSAVTGSTSDYLGDALLARGTELPKYQPETADPLLGGAALVAGRDPGPRTKTIVHQLTGGAERTWRAYAPGAPNCTDAPSGIPLLAFPTVTSTADCAERVATLDQLPADLAAKGGPPAFSYVATDPTLDAAALDAQLRQVVEPIRRSAAFKRAGLIAIVPTSVDPVAATGALILSPFAEASTAVDTPVGPHALLRTVADLLDLPRPGGAAAKDVTTLGPDVLTSPED